MRKRWRALCIALFALAPGVALGAAVEHVRVDHFAVYGNTQLTPAQLVEVLAPYSGRELDGTGLAAAATALRDAYRRLGLFAAEVFIPPHAIADGVATLHVYEGVLEKDGVFLENNGRRVRDEVVLDILGANLASGKLMHTDDFERALLLVEDLPGITAHSLVYPGTEAGEGRFLMRTEDTPAISGNVDIDNFGSVYTGQTRLGTTLYWNSPSGLGDQATLRAVASAEDYRYIFLDYSRPMAGNGLRAGLNADYMNYELGDKFDGTGARGDAVALRVFATYPFVRTRHANSRGRLEYAYLRLDDDNNVEALRAERQIHTLAASVSGDLDHDALADGITYFDLAAVIGRLGIIGSNEFAALEAETTDAEGEFGLLRVHLSRLQHITGNWSAFGSLKGQVATGNLDPSQKFFIGGPFGVPGYPTGEASGDHGVSVFADLRRDFTSPPWGGNFQLSVFYAQGYVQLYDETWDGWQGDNPLIRNSIRLSSWGVAMSQTWPGSVVMRGSIGRQIGRNPGRNPATGADSDGSTRDHRAWFQLIYYF